MAAKLAFDIIANDRASKVFDQIGAKAQGTEGKLNKVGTGMSGTLGKIGAGVAGLTAGFTAFDKVVVGGFQRFTALENAEKRMDSMGLATSETAGLMDQLTDTLTGTAFSLDAGASTMANFIAAGVDLDKVNDRLEMTADTAAFAIQPLDEIGNIFGKIQTQGKLTAEELNMLQERGVPALVLLADAAGVTAEAMRDMISRGEIDAERFFQLWEQGSEGFGENNIKIEGAAKSMGDTLSGSLANAGTAAAKLGEIIVDDVAPFIKDLSDGFITLAGGIKKLDENTKGWDSSLSDLISKAREDDINWWEKSIPNLLGLLDEATTSTGGWGTETDRVRGVLEEFIPTASAAADELGQNASQAQLAADTLGAYLDTVARATDPVLALSGALDAVDAAQEDYNASVEEYGENSPQAQAAALNLAGAVAKAESAAIDGRLSFDQFDRKLEQWVAQGAITAAQADNIRSRVRTLRGEAENFAGTYKATLDLKTQGLNTWQNAKAWLDSIKSKTVTITAHAQLPPGVTTRQIMEGRQHGGPVLAGEPYIVGERGPELFVPNRSGMVLSNRESKAAAGGGSPAAGAGGMDSRRFARDFVDEMQRRGMVVPRMDLARRADLLTRGG